VVYSKRAVELAPSEPLWRRTLATIYALAGRYDDGVRECAVGQESRSTCAETMALLGGVPGHREAGLAALGARARLPGVTGSPTWAAMVYAHVGMADSMFSRLAVAVDRRDDVFGHLITYRGFAPYKQDPRWDAIVGAVRR
jgi:hypothetical protein